MKNKKTIIASFIIVAVIQIFTSASIIYKYEDTLITGNVYKFKTAPVDPYDAFRGRYVSLNLENIEVKLNKNFKEITGQKVYSTIKKNKDGFSFIDNLSIQKPNTDDYIITTIQSIQKINDKDVAFLSLPIDRYYMEEDLAPQAERAYSDANSNSKKNSYISVRIKSGFPVIEDLYIDDIPIKEYINKKQVK